MKILCHIHINIGTPKSISIRQIFCANFKFDGLTNGVSKIRVGGSIPDQGHHLRQGQHRVRQFRPPAGEGRHVERAAGALHQSPSPYVRLFQGQLHCLFTFFLGKSLY
jgi:hypothetical protein